MSFPSTIRSLIGEIGDDLPCTAAEVSAAICDLLSEITLVDDTECELLSDWESEIRDQLCQVIGRHNWEYDQCGYWGHKYCTGCKARKYPDLAAMSCSDAKRHVGHVSEEQYLKSERV